MINTLEKISSTIKRTFKLMITTSSRKKIFIFKSLELKIYDVEEGNTGYTLDHFDLSLPIDRELLDKLTEYSNLVNTPLILVHNQHRLTLNQKDCEEVVTAIFKLLEEDIKQG